MKKTKRGLIRIIARICTAIILLHLTNNLTKPYILKLIIEECVLKLIFGSFRKNNLCIKDNNISLKIKLGVNFQLVYKKTVRKILIN